MLKNRVCSIAIPRRVDPIRSLLRATQGDSCSLAIFSRDFREEYRELSFKLERRSAPCFVTSR